VYYQNGLIADSDSKIESERRRLFHLFSNMAFSSCFTYRTRQWFDYNNTIFAFPRLIRHRQKGFSQIPPYTELRRIMPILVYVALGAITVSRGHGNHLAD
jgi:hypothetical protein